MFVRKLHLALGTHHAVAFDATDFANTDGRINTGHIDTRFCNNNRDAFTCIWRTTNDLCFARVGFHLTHAQFICVRVFFRMHNFADGKLCQSLGRVFDAFHLKP